MSRRGIRILKTIGILYLVAVIALLVSIPYGRSQRTRPELIRKPVPVPVPEHFRGWRSEARFEKAGREFVRAGYILRVPAGGLPVGRVLGEKELDTLTRAEVAEVNVFDPRLVRELAAQKVRAGEEIRAAGRVLVRVGDELTEDRLVELAMACDEAPEGEAREKLWVKGSGSIMGFDLTLVFTGLNFLALVALLYAFLWEPLTRLLDDRARAIREDIETASSEREEAESLKAEVEKELTGIRAGAREMREEGRAEGEKERARLVEDGREEARRLVERAERQAAAEAERAREGLTSEVALLSADLASKMLQRTVSPADHERLTEEFVRSLEADGRSPDRRADGGA